MASQGFIGTVDATTNGLSSGPLVKCQNTGEINVVTTSASGSISPGLNTITPLSMTSIQPSYPLIVDTIGSGVQETILVTATTATTFTAYFNNNHTGPVSFYLTLERLITCIGDPTNVSNVTTVNSNGSLNVAIASTRATTTYNTTTANTVLSNLPLTLVQVLVTTSPVSSIFVYDNSSTPSGNIISAIPAGAPVGTLQLLNVPAVNGITIAGSASGGKLTFMYR